MEHQLDLSVIEHLSTKDAKLLHDLVDNLQSCGVGKIVNLPQITVVGEQNAGKSSVLEAIARVRFPVHADVCTRFATELVLRRAPINRIDASIRFHDKSKLSKNLKRTTFRPDDLPSIIEEAKLVILPQGGRDFSKDVLRLEIEGPDMYPLTLVDLPGIFRNNTEAQSGVGMKRVNELVASFIKQENTIILAVISATADLAMQGTLTTVRECDPDGKRTLGVITKPDRLNPGSVGETTFLRVARNEESTNRLDLGWHVLRNRAEDEPDLSLRDGKEADFFKSTTWYSLPESSRGCQSLREKLGILQYQHLRNNLPEVIGDIETKLQQRETALHQLGKPRSQIQDMREFLIDIAEDFRRLARDGIEGRYGDKFFNSVGLGPWKLRAELRNFNRALDYVLKTKGAARTIIADDDLVSDDESYSPDDKSNSPEDSEIPEYLQEFFEKYPYDFPDPEEVTRADLSVEVERKAALNQGRELPGMPNQGLIVQLFQEQAAPWEKIASFHISQVTLVAKAFVDQLFQHIAGSPESSHTTEAILSTKVDDFFQEKEKLLKAKLAELIQPYEQGYALPLDAEFQQLDAFTFEDRLLDHLRKLAEEGELERLTRRELQDILMDSNVDNGSEFGTGKVIDMMEKYYQLSRRTFTDNIITLGIESCLICHIPDILTPAAVNKMDEDELRQLAEETSTSASRRRELAQEIETLKDGLAQCRRYKQRQVTKIGAASQRGAAKRDLAEEPPALSITDTTATLQLSSATPSSAATNLTPETTNDGEMAETLHSDNQIV